MLGNISIGKKIGIGFGICIALLGALAAISWFGINNSQEGFTQYREIARDNVLMGRIQANLLEARLQVKNFIQTGDPGTVNKFEERFSGVTEFIAEAKEAIENPKRAKLVAQMDSSVGEYSSAFKDVVALQAKREQLMSEVMVPVGTRSAKALNELMDVAAREGNTDASQTAAHTQEDFLMVRIYLIKFLDDNNNEHIARTREEAKNAQAELSKMKTQVNTPQQKQLIAQFEDGLKNYMAGVEDVAQTINQRNDIIENKLDTIGPQIAGMAEEVKLSIKEEQDTIGPRVKAENEQTSRTTLIASVFGIILALVFAIVIAKSITVPVRGITEIAKRLSIGDVEQIIEINQKDEIGQLANAFRDMVTAQRSKADVAKSIANGNLDMEIQVLSEQDTLGKSMVLMKEKIGQLVSDTNELVKFAVQGNLEKRADSSGHAGEFKSIVDGINNLMDAVVGPLQNATEYMSRLSEGDIPERIRENYQGDFNRIKDAVNRCIDALNNLQNDLSTTIELQKQGDIEATCSPEKLQGAYAELAQGINEALFAVIKPTTDAIDILGKYAEGDLTQRMRDLPGKQIILTEAMNKIKNNVGRMVTDEIRTVLALKERMEERIVGQGLLDDALGSPVVCFLVEDHSSTIGQRLGGDG